MKQRLGTGRIPTMLGVIASTPIVPTVFVFGVVFSPYMYGTMISPGLAGRVEG
jgi:hypothetical protein